MKVSENLSILFLLEKSEMSKAGLAPVYARFTIHGTRKEMSLGFTIHPEQWNHEKQSVIGTDKETKWYNSRIAEIRTRLQKLELLLEARNEWVTADLLKKAYKEDWDKPVTEKTPKKQERTLCQTCNFKYSRFAVLAKKSYVQVVRLSVGILLSENSDFFLNTSLEVGTFHFQLSDSLMLMILCISC